MLVSCCGQSAVTACNTCAEQRGETQPAPRWEGNATVLTTWRTHRRTRRGTLAGRKLIRHIKCVRLTTASYKLSAYHNKSGINMDCIINVGKVTVKVCNIYPPLLLNKMALEIQFSLTNGLNT